jgi:hypothetical protein
MTRCILHGRSNVSSSPTIIKDVVFNSLAEIAFCIYRIMLAAIVTAVFHLYATIDYHFKTGLHEPPQNSRSEAASK